MDQQDPIYMSQGRCALHARTIPLDGRDGLRMHILEAFPSESSTNDPSSLPLVLLLHGFPELAYSWRKILTPLADAHKGYHVVAPDLRGYGRTVIQHDGDAPKQIQFDDPLAPFHVLNIVEDVRALIKALGREHVFLLVGHDFGSLVAGHCVYAHRELFHSVVFMSAPFSGVERPPRSASSPDEDTADIVGPKSNSLPTLVHAVSAALASLSPPRKHYTAYFSTRDANKDMLGESEEDVYNFLGGYYHMKSGAWEGNTIHPLPSSASNPSPTIDELARDIATLPEYYVMPADQTMRQVISRHANQHPNANFTWAPEDAESGRAYASEFARTGFQGGLNYYRCALSPPPAERIDELIALSLSERKIIPAAFISGARDWGVYQTPGAVDKMRLRFEIEDDDFVLIDGAGHWVQQEAPEQVIAALVKFIDKVVRRAD